MLRTYYLLPIYGNSKYVCGFKYQRKGYITEYVILYSPLDKVFTLEANLVKLGQVHKSQKVERKSMCFCCNFKHTNRGFSFMP